MKHQGTIIKRMETPADGRAQLLQEAQTNIMTQDGFTDVIALSDRLGVEVYQADMKDSENGYIEYDKESRNTYIVINQNHPVTRQRFTVAHELGHFINDYDELVKCGRLDRAKSTHSSGIEAAADRLAAEILMPEDKAREYLNNIDKGHSWTTKIEIIANHFRVSRSMAIIRLRELGESVPYIEFA